MVCSIKSIKANFVTLVKGEILEYIGGTTPLYAYMICIKIF